MQRTRIGYGKTDLNQEPKEIVHPSKLGSEDLSGKVEFKTSKPEKKQIKENDKRVIDMITAGGQKDAHLLTEFVIEERVPAFLIALMQFLIALSTEIISMLTLNGQREIFDVIANFIAIKAISEIDNIFISGQTDYILQKITEPGENEDNWTPKRIYNKIDFLERGYIDRILFSFYKLMKLLYNSFYFYFFPFVIILLNIVSKRCEDIIDPDVDIVNGQPVATGEFLCEHLEVFYIKRIFTMALFKK